MKEGSTGRPDPGGIVALVDDPEWPLVRTAAEAADEKLGADTRILQVGDVLGVTGWFVITSGANNRQVRAIAENVEHRLTAVGVKPLSVEGRNSMDWVLLDYGGFVVHVFEKSQREFYDLERLWRDVPSVRWPEDGVGA